jgi:hypothetical protein
MFPTLDFSGLPDKGDIIIKRAGLGDKGLTRTVLTTIAKHDEAKQAFIRTAAIIQDELKDRIDRQGKIFNAHIEPSIGRAVYTGLNTWAVETMINKNPKAVPVASIAASTGLVLDYLTSRNSFQDLFDYPVIIEPNADRALFNSAVTTLIMKQMGSSKPFLYSFLELTTIDYFSRKTYPSIVGLIPKKQQLSRVDAIALSQLTPEELAEHAAGHPIENARPKTLAGLVTKKIADSPITNVLGKILGL